MTAAVADDINRTNLDADSISADGAQASYNGQGTAEILEIIEMLERESIISCVMGTRALRYYGAPRATEVSSIAIGSVRTRRVRGSKYANYCQGLGALCFRHVL